MLVGQFHDAESGGQTAAPGDVRLPESQRPGICDVFESVVGEFMLAAG